MDLRNKMRWYLLSLSTVTYVACSKLFTLLLLNTNIRSRMSVIYELRERILTV